MDKPKTISYSSWNNYLTCGMKYKIEKILGYEPLLTSSALIFGGAIDDALNELLINNDIDKAKSLFKDKIKCLYKSADYYFFKGDFDYDILTEKQIDLGLNYLKELNYKGTSDLETIHKMLFKKVYDHSNDYHCLSENQRLILSCISTMSLKEKGIMMIDAYVEKILPQIEEVISVQKETKDRNGFIDLEVKLKGYGNVTADNKTAARMYKQSDVDYSPQLLIYDKECNNKQIAYFVLGKTIKKNKEKKCKSCGFSVKGGSHTTCNNEISGKRCKGEWEVFITPEIDVGIFVSDVNENVQKKVLDSLKSVEDAIYKEAFPMNLNSCPNQFGKPCPYIEFCDKGNTDKMKKRKARK